MPTLPQSWPDLTPKLSSFFEIWDEMRQKTGDIPYRRDLGLPKLGRLAPFITILERIAPGEMHVKMTGTEIDAQFGRNLSGVNVADVTEPQARKALISFHEALMDQPCGGYAHDILITENGKRLSAKYLILPLKNRFGELNQCASICDSEFAGFSAAPGMDTPHITYKEFQRSQHLDLGYGLPDYTPLIEHGYIAKRPTA